jgi:hypothetical protein
MGGAIPSQEGWATYPALATDGSGTVWAAWLERLDGADAVFVAPIGSEAGPMGDSGDGAARAGRHAGPRSIARANAIKDGPALAWSADTGLCCAWQYREPGGSGDAAGGAAVGQVWRLTVATHLEAGTAETWIAPDETAEDGSVLRPSHPVLASGGDALALGYELHGPTGAGVVVRTVGDAVWSQPIALSRLHPPEQGEPESAYDLALAVGPDRTLWAAWIEARDAGFAVWTAHAPVRAAADSRAWSVPERISAGPHLPAAPRALATPRGVWVAWSNFSGSAQPEKLPAWADGPDRRWERLLHTRRRRIHVRRRDASTGTWGPEWREPEPADATPGAAERSLGSSHFPVLIALEGRDGQEERGPDEGPRTKDGSDSSSVLRLSSSESVAVLCRRAVPRALGWSVEAYRLEAHGDGRITWSAPVPLTTGAAPARPTAPVDTSQVTEGSDMPVAFTLPQSDGGEVTLAWQRHDRRRTARGFHLTPGASALVVTRADLGALPAAGRESTAVDAAQEAPETIRFRPAPRTVTIDGETYRLVFGNMHRHAESSLCGIDNNGRTELHMRHAPDVNRSAFLAVTDHGEHLNDAGWREQCLLADFYTWPGHRAALPGIEWTSEAPWQPAAHGHKNVIFSRSDLPFVDCWMPHSDHPGHLWDWLRAHDPQAVTIPHHTMRGKTPTFWDHVDADYQPVVEIFQDRRGSAEWLGAPAATSTTRVQGLAIDPRGSIRRALDKGLKVGLVASGDHGGVALAGLYVKEISRAGILDALRARRCFATTGDRMLLDFRINGVFQGGEIALPKLPRGPENQSAPLEVTIRAEVLRPVHRVVLVRDGYEAETLTPASDARTISHTWQIEAPFIGTSYFYVRIESADGELAWSSPIWVTMDWSNEPIREP